MDDLVLTIIGPDRTGLVEALSQVVTDHGGSWDRSHVTELAGWFAGVVAVRIPSRSTDDFEAALPGLQDRGLDVVVRRAGDRAMTTPGARVDVQIMGADRPGIVREISTLLTSLGVGIVDLQTRTEPAAMAGGHLFRVSAQLSLPEGLDRVGLAGALEDLAGDLMVDLAED